MTNYGRARMSTALTMAIAALVLSVCWMLYIAHLWR